MLMIPASAVNIRSEYNEKLKKTTQEKCKQLQHPVQ